VLQEAEEKEVGLDGFGRQTLPSGWEEYFDDGYALPYYLNTLTSETQVELLVACMRLLIVVRLIYLCADFLCIYATNVSASSQYKHAVGGARRTRDQ
jgi:hypothetical protein